MNDSLLPCPDNPSECQLLRCTHSGGDTYHPDSFFSYWCFWMFQTKRNTLCFEIFLGYFLLEPPLFQKKIRFFWGLRKNFFFEIFFYCSNIMKLNMVIPEVIKTSNCHIQEVERHNSFHFLD